MSKTRLNIKMMSQKERDLKKDELRQMFNDMTLGNEEKRGELIREEVIEKMDKLSGDAKKGYKKIDKTRFEAGRDMARIVRPLDEKYRSERYQPYDPKSKAVSGNVSVGSSCKGKEVTVVADSGND